MTHRYEGEIIRLHRFFEDWFTGRLPKTDAAFAAFADSMASGFAIVDPTGRVTELETLSQKLYDAHGQQSEFQIDIKNVTLRRAINNLAIVTYEEWQQIGSEQTARLSTVIMERDLQSERLEWLHVHETWLPEEETHE